MGNTLAMSPKTDLTGKVAVITGAASGIGLELALHAADRGMKVALADEDQNLLAAAVEKVKAKDGEAIAIPTDVLAFDAVRQLARRTEAELGPPWLLCNSSAASVAVNLWGMIHGVQVFVPDMVKRGSGHIINVTSAGLLGTGSAACSVAMKHAIVGLSESLYRELDLKGSPVGVTLVYPALGNTSLTSATEHENSVVNLLCDLRERVLPPADVAEQVFAAITQRRFWVFPHEPKTREMSLRKSEEPWVSENFIAGVAGERSPQASNRRPAPSPKARIRTRSSREYWPSPHCRARSGNPGAR